MRLIVLLLAGTVYAGFAAAAEAETVLHLSETATIMAPPDELAASLRVDAILPTAAAAQARVNEVMRDALAAVRSTPGLTVSTGGYSVWRIAPTQQEKAERWQAGQTLNVSGTDDAAILKLVERLQQKGLAVGNLGWRLSRQAERKAHQEATRQALSALRGRIDEAADVIGLRFEQFKEVRLDGPQRQPPMLRAMAAPMAMAASGAPPSTAPEDVAVDATADADAILQPK